LYERYFWIPVLISLVITLGCGGDKLYLQAEAAPADASTILSYGSLMAGFMVPYGGIVSDFAVYISPKGSTYVKPPVLVFYT
jgi:purine-cytosine permease-like protein